MSTITRIVCGDKGEMHYSSTPDLAMDICPVCDTRTVAKTIDIPEPKTLLDLLYEADAIEIDDFFVRYIELEECEDDDDIALHIALEEDEFMFTKKELETAVPYEAISGYKVVTGSKPNDIYRIVPYTLTEIKA